MGNAAVIISEPGVCQEEWRQLKKEFVATDPPLKAHGPWPHGRTGLPLGSPGPTPGEGAARRIAASQGGQSPPHTLGRQRCGPRPGCHQQARNRGRASDQGIFREQPQATGYAERTSYGRSGAPSQSARSSRARFEEALGDPTWALSLPCSRESSGPFGASAPASARPGRNTCGAPRERSDVSIAHSGRKAPEEDEPLTPGRPPRRRPFPPCSPRDQPKEFPSPVRVEDTKIGKGFGAFLKKGVADAMPKEPEVRPEMVPSKDGGFIATIQKGFEGIFGHLATSKEEMLKKRGPVIAPEYQAVPGDDIDQRVQFYSRQLPRHLGDCLKIFRISKGRYQIGMDEVRLAWSHVQQPRREQSNGQPIREVFVFAGTGSAGSSGGSRRERGQSNCGERTNEPLPYYLRHSANVAYDLQCGGNAISKVPEKSRLSFAEEQGTLLVDSDADAKFNAMTLATEQAKLREQAAMEWRKQNDSMILAEKGLLTERSQDGSAPDGNHFTKDEAEPETGSWEQLPAPPAPLGASSCRGAPKSPHGEDLFPEIDLFRSTPQKESMSMSMEHWQAAWHGGAGSFPVPPPAPLDPGRPTSFVEGQPCAAPQQTSWLPTQAQSRQGSQSGAPPMAAIAEPLSLPFRWPGQLPFSSYGAAATQGPGLLPQMQAPLPQATPFGLLGHSQGTLQQQHYPLPSVPFAR